jgi:hypothetical protein
LCGHCVVAVSNAGGALAVPAAFVGTVALGVAPGPRVWAAWADALELDRAAALMTQARAAGTDSTYASSRRRFVRFIQQVCNRNGFQVSEALIFPSEPGVPVHRDFVLCFLGEAARCCATGTIEGTLAAVRHWHVDKGRGKLQSPTDDYGVRQAMDGIRAAHAGTTFGTPQAALAIQPSMLHLIVHVGDEMIDKAMGLGDYRQAYGYARDLLWYTTSFLTCLRREEAAALRRSHITPGAVQGSLHVFIKKSKTDQHMTGFTLPVAGTTDSGISIAGRLARMDAVLTAWGREPGDVLFGNMNNPSVPLASSQSILDRLMEVYVPELCARGLDVPDSFRYSGHSFRRGGINSIRDAARAAGINGDELRSVLMKFGRWRDPRSLEVYLTEDFVTLTALTQRL